MRPEKHLQPTPPQPETREPTPREKELLDRIRSLEEQNSALQDRLDMIWSILEPDYELPAEDGDDDSGLVQINGVK